ncbi:MAG: hypothetical protein NTX25_13770, partial [Proteobacteria bacterium]|nr:hypothetical protein [Pseudomonadota bacterium]
MSSNVAAAFDIITTHNNTELAGVRFQIKLRARDLSNFIAVSYEGTKNLQFISYAPPAWSGQAGLLPDGILTCTFVQGLCDLPAPAGDTGWYVTDKDIPALVSVTELAGQVSGVWSNFITSTQGPVDRVLFADKIGGEATGAIPIAANSLREITTDNTISLGAALVDKGGNFISNANATWTGTAVLVTPYFNTASPSASNVFNPVKVISAADNAEIRAQSAGATDAVLRVIASHGVANRIDINLPGGTNLTAGDCVPFTATVVDVDGNATTSFNKQLTLQAGMLNSNTTTHYASAYRHGYFNSWDNGGPDLRFLTGFYYLNGNNDWQQAVLDYDPVFSVAPYEYAPAGGWRRSGSLNTLVLNGVINFPYKVCVSDATNVAPQIVMALPAPLDNSYPAVSGTSSVISVSPGSPY